MNKEKISNTEAGLKLFHKFIKSTYYSGYGTNLPTEKTDQMLGLPQPPLQEPYDKTKPLIDLPKPSEIVVPAIDLKEAIDRRASGRNYSEESLTLMELSWLLWATQGVKSYTESPGVGKQHMIKRTVPASGSLNPFETYILVNKVRCQELLLL